jgi:dolichol-phosphate mannosyltransferase
MKALVVVPTYNEAGNIAEVLWRLRTAVPAADILVVDDASPDGTAEIAHAHGADLGGVDVLIRAGKFGLGSAYRDGFIEGLRRGYQILVEIDGDLSHDPAAVPALLRAVESGADLAVGSRYIPGGSVQHWPGFRRLLSRCGNRYARWVLALPLVDATSGLRAYRADIITRLDLPSVQSEGYGFQIEMVYRVARAGGGIVEVPIRFVERKHGTSKMSLHIIVEAFVHVTVWGLRNFPNRWRPFARRTASICRRCQGWWNHRPQPARGETELGLASTDGGN